MAPTLNTAYSEETVPSNTHTALKGTTHIYDMTDWEGPVSPTVIKFQFQGQIAGKTDLALFFCHVVTNLV